MRVTETRFRASVDFAHLLSSETAFRHDAGEMVLGIHVFGLDFGVQVDSTKNPLERKSVSSAHVSHRRTSDSINHLDKGSIVFENVTQGAEARTFCV